MALPGPSAGLASSGKEPPPHGSWATARRRQAPARRAARRARRRMVRPPSGIARTVTRRTLRLAGFAVNARGRGSVARGRADRPGLNFSSAAPLSRGPKPAPTLARRLEADAGTDPGPGPLIL